MKRTFIFLLAIAIPLVSFARTPMLRNKNLEAIQFFDQIKTQHEELKKEILNLQLSGHKQAGLPTATILQGSCGFVGCEEKYLVTAPYSTKGANPQTTVIAAVIKIGAVKPVLVKVVAPQLLQALIRAELPKQN